MKAITDFRRAILTVVGMQAFIVPKWKRNIANPQRITSMYSTPSHPFTVLFDKFLERLLHTMYVACLTLSACLINNGSNFEPTCFSLAKSLLEPIVSSTIPS